MRVYVVGLTLLGVLIHAGALLGFSMGTAPTSVHMLMLLVDTLVVVGLLLKRAWGYWAAVGLYLQQTIAQTYWAWKHPIVGWWQYGVSLLCLLALVALWFLRNEKPNSSNG